VIFGDDSISASNDFLQGSASSDTLGGPEPRDGSDTLYGAGGADSLIGISGFDGFYYANNNEIGDTISSFESGTDKIYLRSSAFGNVSATGTQNLGGGAGNQLRNGVDFAIIDANTNYTTVGGTFSGGTTVGSTFSGGTTAPAIVFDANSSGGGTLYWDINGGGSSNTFVGDNLSVIATIESGSVNVNDIVIFGNSTPVLPAPVSPTVTPVSPIVTPVLPDSNDFLQGSASSDTLGGPEPRDGSDTLYGAGGADSLIGISGFDGFYYAINNEIGDTISSFESGTDKIYLNSFQFGNFAGTVQNLGGGAGNQLRNGLDFATIAFNTSYTTVGGTFSGGTTAPAIVFDDTGAGGTLYWDINGGGNTNTGVGDNLSVIATIESGSVAASDIVIF